MKEAVKEWMAQNPSVEGVLARGVRFPDKTTLTESYSKDFPAVALENAWRCMADAYQVLILHRLPVVRMRWVYEKALLHCGRRQDGIMLGLFTSRIPEEVDAPGLEQWFTSFDALRDHGVAP